MHPWPNSLNAVTINPLNPHLFAVGGNDEFARVYDIRRCVGFMANAGVQGL